MKRIATALFITLFALAFAAPSAHADPKDLPPGSYVNATIKDADTAIVTIKCGAGMELLKVERYIRTKTDPIDVTKDASGAYSFEMKRGHTFNFTWKDSEGVWYALVTPEDNESPPAWMGPGIAATPDYGKGAKMAVRAFFRPVKYE